MSSLTDMSTADLAYLKRKFINQIEELDIEIGTRQARLDNRLERQEEDATAKATLDQQLLSAQNMLAALESHNETAELIAEAEALVQARQTAVNNHKVSYNLVSDREAQLVLIELDEMEAAKVLRTDRIAAIDAILGT